MCRRMHAARLELSKLSCTTAGVNQTAEQMDVSAALAMKLKVFFYKINIKQHFFLELTTIKDYYLFWRYKVKNGNKSHLIRSNLSLIFFIIPSLTIHCTVRRYSFKR